MQNDNLWYDHIWGNTPFSLFLRPLPLSLPTSSDILPAGSEALQVSSEAFTDGSEAVPASYGAL